MHHGDQEFLGDGSSLLKWEATDKGGLAILLLGDDSSQGILREANVGIEEQQSVVLGQLR